MLQRTMPEPDFLQEAAPADAASTAASVATTLDAFLDAMGPRAFRFAELGLRDREDALDAVQDAMLKMLAYRGRPAAEWTPLFWSILRSRIVDVQRRRGFRLRWLRPQATQGSDDEAIDWTESAAAAHPESDPSRHHDSKEAWTRIADALQSLPARQREAFTLRVLEELDVADTARVMGCSEGSVKTHLFRAREALQAQLEEFR